MGTLNNNMDLKDVFKKKFFSFKETFDFNFLSNLLDRNNFESNISSNPSNKFLFDSSFRIMGVENDYYFKELFNLLNNDYNKENKKADLHIYFSLVSGSKSITHRDGSDVIIISLYGTTIYKIEEDYFTLEPGDFLFIEKNKLHKAIALTPRIILSYGTYKI